jgi:hypothetical protein
MEQDSLSLISSLHGLLGKTEGDFIELHHLMKNSITCQAHPIPH